MITSVMHTMDWESTEGFSFIDLVAGDIWGTGLSIFFTSLFNMLQIVQGTYKISICNYDIFFHGLHFRNVGSMVFFEMDQQ